MSCLRLASIVALLAACSRSAPPVETSREGAPSASAVEAASPPAARSAEPVYSALPSASASGTPAGVPPASASGSASTPPPTADVEAPALKDAAGQVLPQTDVRPSTASPFFQQQARRLFDAIVADDAELARGFFFPLVAYEQVKDVKNPARDWEYRLIAAFKRQVHEYHGLLGRRRAQTRFLRLDVPEDRAEWMKPGREGNRFGYHRVLRSRLWYADADAKERSLEVTSLISWRGEWYLVHLHGFE